MPGDNLLASLDNGYDFMENHEFVGVTNQAQATTVIPFAKTTSSRQSVCILFNSFFHPVEGNISQ